VGTLAVPADGVSLVVLPSPLLPARTYEGLAAGLARLGFDASVADSGLRAGEGAAELVDRWTAALEPGSVLVAHSNAGLLAPRVRAGQGSDAAIVFMDAALPPERGTYALSPTRFREHLGTLADASGMLPPWTRWWPREDMEGLLTPDDLDDVDRACPRLPLAYFDGRLEAPGGWACGRNAYLAFGDTYADEVAIAERLGWPVARLGGQHLEFLRSAASVAAAVARLTGDLSGEGRRT
jgi:hypothetical protein